MRASWSHRNDLRESEGAVARDARPAGIMPTTETGSCRWFVRIRRRKNGSSSRNRAQELIISQNRSRVTVRVIRTDEEIQIAKSVYELLSRLGEH